MTPIKLSELEAKAKQATPGRWKGDEYEITAPDAPTLLKGNVRLVYAEDRHFSENDAAFILAAQPLTISRLCEALKIAYSELKKYSDHENERSCIYAQEAISKIDTLVNLYD